MYYFILKVLYSTFRALSIQFFSEKPHSSSFFKKVHAQPKKAVRSPLYPSHPHKGLAGFLYVVNDIIRYIDMLAGIGGFREGLTCAGGFECTGHCELDAHADRSYYTLFDTEGEWFCADAREADPAAMPAFDLLCEGFSWRSFSIAGRRGRIRRSKRYAVRRVPRLRLLCRSRPGR